MTKRKFKYVVWEGSRGRSETVVYAPSYGAVYNTYIAPLPPSYIATLEPLDD